MGVKKPDNSKFHNLVSLILPSKSNMFCYFLQYWLNHVYCYIRKIKLLLQILAMYIYILYFFLYDLINVVILRDINLSFPSFVLYTEVEDDDTT